MAKEYTISQNAVVSANTPDYIIAKKQPIGLVVDAGRAAGESAVIIAGIVRNNAPEQNKYLGAIDQTSYKDSPIAVSPLGTPVYSDVTFLSTSYIDKKGNTITTPRVNFQAILVSVVFPRNIVKTEIQGRDGTVKEYIGEGDAQITFRGVLTGRNGQHPADQIAQLKTIIKAPVPIPVSCAYLQNLDIDTVVFEDRELGQEEGGHSYQAFSLNAISDTPQELQITGQ